MPEQDPSDQFVDMVTGGISKLFGILEKKLEERKQRNKANDEKYFAQQKALKDKEEAAELRKQDREFQKAENQRLIDALSGGMKQVGMEPTRENLEMLTKQVERLEEIDARKEDLGQQTDALNERLENIDKEQADLLKKPPVDVAKLQELSTERADIKAKLSAFKLETAKLDEEATNIKAGEGQRGPQQEQAFVLTPGESQRLNAIGGRQAQLKVKSDMLSTRLDAINKEQTAILNKNPVDVAALKELSKERDLLNAELGKTNTESTQLGQEATRIKDGSPARKDLQDKQFEKGMTPEGKKRLTDIDTRQGQLKEHTGALNERLDNINKEQADLLTKTPFNDTKFKELSDERADINAELSSAQKESTRLSQESEGIKGQAQRDARQIDRQQSQQQGKGVQTPPQSGTPQQQGGQKQHPVTSRPTGSKITKPLPQPTEEQVQRLRERRELAEKMKKEQSGPSTEVDSDKLKSEQEKALKEKEQQEKALKEKQEQEKALKEKEQQEKALKEKEEQEKALKEKEQQEKALKEKEEQEKALKEKEQQEKALKEKEEQEKALKEKEQQEKALKEKEEQEKALKEKEQQEKALKEKQEQEKALKEKQELEKQQKLEAEKLEKENQLKQQEQLKADQLKKDQQLKADQLKKDEQLKSEGPGVKEGNQQGVTTPPQSQSVTSGQSKIGSPKGTAKGISSEGGVGGEKPKFKTAKPNSTRETLDQQQYPYFGSARAKALEQSKGPKLAGSGKKVGG